MTQRDFVNKVWSGRFYDAQLPKLITAYNIIYILLEGVYRYDNGYVRLNSGKRLLGGQCKEVTYQQFQSMIWTLSFTVPAARILWTDDQRDTVCTLLALEHWWRQDSNSHTSHLKIYAPPPTLNGRQVHVTKLVHQVARQLPGVGDGKCFKVAEHFKSTKRMINATAADWRQLEGVGRVTADRIVKQIEEEL